MITLIPHFHFHPLHRAASITGFRQKMTVAPPEQPCALNGVLSLWTATIKAALGPFLSEMAVATLPSEKRICSSQLSRSSEFGGQFPLKVYIKCSATHVSIWNCLRSLKPAINAFLRHTVSLCLLKRSSCFIA